jgi:hypothetical protein
MIDKSINTSLIVLELYPKYRIIFGYNVYATDMGVYQGHVSDSTIAPFLVLNSSKNDGKYFMANNSIKTL